MIEKYDKNQKHLVIFQKSQFNWKSIPEVIETINLQCYISYCFFLDALHTYFGVCGFALMEMYNVKPLHPALNISMDAYERLLNIHSTFPGVS